MIKQNANKLPALTLPPTHHTIEVILYNFNGKIAEKSKVKSECGWWGGQQGASWVRIPLRVDCSYRRDAQYILGKLNSNGYLISKIGELENGIDVLLATSCYLCTVQLNRCSLNSIESKACPLRIRGDFNFTDTSKLTTSNIITLTFIN